VWDCGEVREYYSTFAPVAEDVQRGESSLFDEEEEERRGEEEEDGECVEGVLVGSSRLWMLYKLSNGCSSEVREREVEESRFAFGGRNERSGRTSSTSQVETSPLQQQQLASSPFLQARRQGGQWHLAQTGADEERRRPFVGVEERGGRSPLVRTLSPRRPRLVVV
jgi:hypothetical protein